jgi:hypothetical protein
MDDEDPLHSPARQSTLSHLPLRQIDEIAQHLLRLRGAGDASDPMPLEVAHGAHPAMGLDPLELDRDFEFRSQQHQGAPVFLCEAWSLGAKRDRC